MFDLDQGYYSFHPFASPIYLSAELMQSVQTKILFMMISFLIFEKLCDISLGIYSIDLPYTVTNKNAYNYILIMLCIIVLFGGLYFGFSSLATTDMEQLRGGAIGKFSLLIIYTQIVLIGMPAFYFLRFNRPYIAIICAATFLFTYLLLGGSRQIIVFSIAIFVSLILYKSGKSKYVILILLFTVGFSSIDFVLQLFKLLRNLPSMDARLDFAMQLIAGKIPWSALTADQLGSESNVRYVMYGFLSESPPSDFGKFSYFGRSLLFWLPSSLDFLGIKPADFEATMFAEAMGNRSGTMHATFFGSAYADTGIYSFIWIGWFVAIFRALDWWLNKIPIYQRSFVWGSCIYFSFMVARGSFYAPLVVMTVALLVAQFLIYLDRHNTGAKISAGGSRA
ncbi:hypothetical protein ACFFJ0_05755 [Sphingobium scionense]|uniref:hypothetical protein n=1 Tax=Sphingobium scionense TaxID=1404341 RepID=UPI0035EAAD48